MNLRSNSLSHLKERVNETFIFVIGYGLRELDIYVCMSNEVSHNIAAKQF